MSSRSAKVPNHLHDDWTVISADSDDGSGDRVTYLSKNTRDGRQFEAVSPPNSVHAKKLAELAMLVQSNQRGHRRPVAALTTSGPRVAQIAPAMYQTQVPRIKEIPDPAGPGSPTTGVGPTTPNIRTQTPTSTYAPAPYISELQPASDPRYQPPEVYRYSTEQQTGYNVTTRTGKLRVIAPVGSSEAEAFDAVVEKLSSKEEHRYDKERKVRRRSAHKEHERKRSGWAW